MASEIIALKWQNNLSQYQVMNLQRKVEIMQEKLDNTFLEILQEKAGNDELRTRLSFLERRVTTIVNQEVRKQVPPVDMQNCYHGVTFYKLL